MGDEIMCAYSVGLATKEKILSVCKELFYEKGLKATSYNDICEKADINRGLLPYHFKSKNNIAIQVFREFIDQFDSIMGENLNIDDFNVYFAATEFVLFDLIKNNHNLRRFYNEIESEETFVESTMMMQRDIINQIIDANKLSFQEDELRTIICMFEGVEMEIIRNMQNGYITESIDKVVKRDLHFVFNQLGFERNEISEIIGKAKKIIAGYELIMEKAFFMELVRK